MVYNFFLLVTNFYLYENIENVNVKIRQKQIFRESSEICNFTMSLKSGNSRINGETLYPESFFIPNTQIFILCPTTNFHARCSRICLPTLIYFARCPAFWNRVTESCIASAMFHLLRQSRLWKFLSLYTPQSIKANCLSELPHFIPHPNPIPLSPRKHIFLAKTTQMLRLNRLFTIRRVLSCSCKLAYWYNAHLWSCIYFSSLNMYQSDSLPGYGPNRAALILITIFIRCKSHCRLQITIFIF